jgi:hypothetical protein
MLLSRVYRCSTINLSIMRDLNRIITGTLCLGLGHGEAVHHDSFRDAFLYGLFVRRLVLSEALFC